MRIVYMGTPDFAVGPLKALCEAGYEIVSVVTQPDRPKGRSGKLVFSPVKEYAVSRDIEVFQPEKIRTADSVEYLKGLDADIFVVAAFGQILSKEVLDIPRYGCVNIHASLLPLYRGASPIQQALLDGREQTGVTLMQMDVGMDTGDILMQKTIDILNTDTAGTLFDKLMELGSDMIVEAMPLIEEGKLIATPQDERLASKVGKLTKEMGRIDWTLDAAYIDRQIRTMDPWPSAYCTYKGKTIKIWKARPIENTEQESAYGNIPGTVITVSKSSFVVACGDGLLEVAELQPESKKRMSAGDFIRGNHLAVGERME